MEEETLPVVVLFLKLEEALRGLLGQVETRGKRRTMGVVEVAVGLTAEQTELTDLRRYQAEMVMAEQVEILELGVLEERGVLAQ